MPRSPHRGARVRIALLTACALFAASATAHAATPSMTITGNLRGATGMTLLALSPSGTAVQQKLGAKGRFALKVPRGQGTTLQLVTAGGRYFGPVVLASKKGKAYSAIAPATSVKLGALSLRSGFAAPKTALAYEARRSHAHAGRRQEGPPARRRQARAREDAGPAQGERVLGRRRGTAREPGRRRRRRRPAQRARHGRQRQRPDRQLRLRRALAQQRAVLDALPRLQPGAQRERRRHHAHADRRRRRRREHVQHDLVLRRRRVQERRPDGDRRARRLRHARSTAAAATAPRSWAGSPSRARRRRATCRG